MPATLLQSKYGAGVPGVVTLDSPISVGDLVIVSIAGWQRRGYSISDNLGNTYTEIGESTQSFSSTGMAYTYATVAGTPTITVTNSVTGGAAGSILVSVRVYDFPDSQFDQGVFAAGWYGTPGVGYHGGGTGPFSLADTLVLSSALIGGNSPYTWDDPSPSGDDLAEQHDVGIPGGSASFTVFERSATGPGTSSVNLINRNSNAGSPYPAITTGTFSASVTRPAANTKQYAATAGAGAVLGVYNGQDTVTLSLAYMPTIGDLIVVGCGCGQYFGANKTFTVSDAYGNTYTQQQTDNQASARAQSAIFTCVVTAVPSSGVFQITMTMSGGTGTFDASSLMAAEYTGLDLTGTIIGRPYASNTNGLIKTTTAPANYPTVIVGFTYNFLFFGNTDVVWTDSGLFVIKSDLTSPVAGNTDYVQTQQSRFGLAALVELFIPSSASYAAEVLIDIDDPSASMVMVVVPYTAPPTVTPGSGGSGALAMPNPNDWDLCLVHEYKLYSQLDPDALRCGKKPACFNTDPREWDKEANYQ